MAAENQITPPFTGRRFFIKKSIFGASALAFAQLLPLGCSRHIPPCSVHPELKYFTTEEAYLLSVIAQRIIPIRADDDAVTNDVIVRLDGYFIDALPEDQEEFTRLLKIFNHPVFVFLFAGSLTSYDRMSDSQKDNYLHGWMTSRWSFRRTAFQALKRLIMSMYYTRQESWEAIGYPGPLV